MKWNIKTFVQIAFHAFYNTFEWLHLGERCSCSKYSGCSLWIPSWISPKTIYLKFELLFGVLLLVWMVISVSAQELPWNRISKTGLPFIPTPICPSRCSFKYIKVFDLCRSEMTFLLFSCLKLTWLLSWPYFTTLFLIQPYYYPIQLK